jgi:uncharacterized protein (TIGR02594 family)
MKQRKSNAESWEKCYNARTDPREVILDAQAKSDKNNSPWIDTTAGENGVKEDKDPKKCCPAIEKYNQAIDPKWKSFMFEDEKNAWCACHAAWVLKENGFQDEIPKGVDSIRARSYSKCWCKSNIPLFGAMAIFHGPGNQGHVGFVVGISSNSSESIVIGGNQNDKVQPSRYNIKGKTGNDKDGVTLIEYRYPCDKNGKVKNGQSPIDYNAWNVSRIDKKGVTR